VTHALGTTLVFFFSVIAGGWRQCTEYVDGTRTHWNTICLSWVALHEVVYIELSMIIIIIIICTT